MKIIDEYLNRLYKDDDSKDAEEIKEEIKEHLITSAKEYMNQGYLEDEAQNKAIEQFDGGNDEDASIELRSIYTKKIDVRKERVKKLASIRLKEYLICLAGFLVQLAYLQLLAFIIQFLNG